MGQKYHWVSVGGNPTEPAIIKDRKVYTIGCHDPHPMAGIKDFGLIEKPEHSMTDPERLRAERAWDRARQREAKKNIYRGYRRF